MTNLPPNPDGYGQQPQPTQPNGAYGQNVPPQGAYGQPAPGGYGQQQPGQTPYGQPYQQQSSYPGYYPYPYAPMVPYNTLAIVGFVLAIVVSPAGIICSAISLRQIKQTGERGHGLALAGVIVGAALTAFFILYIILIIVAIVVGVATTNTYDYSTTYS